MFGVSCYLQRAIAATLTAMIVAVAHAQTVTKIDDPFAKELEAINSLAAQRKPNDAVARLDALAKRVAEAHLPPLRRCQVMRQALGSLVWSPVDESPAVKSAALKWALTTISETRGKGVVATELIQVQMELALDVLPRTSALPEQIAQASLPLWRDLLAAVANLSAYDPWHPKVQLEMPVPPAGFSEFFVFGESPDCIKDPAFRKQYADFLRKRDEVGCKGGEYGRLAEFRGCYFPKLQGVLNSAYSGSPEKEKAGKAAIEKYIPDPDVRKELLKAMKSRPPEREWHVIGKIGIAPRTESHAPIEPLTVPARPGSVIVRGREGSQSTESILAVANAFPSKGSLDVAFDDYASFGRFCDDDAPYHVVIEEGVRTPRDELCSRRQFPRGSPQPGAYLIGQLRVLFAVNSANPIRSLNFAQIRNALYAEGKQVHWQDLGGTGTAAIHCFGPQDKTWARQLVQDKCMSRWHDANQPGVRDLQRLAYRDDLVSCADAKEVLAKVRGDRNALGFFACCEPLSKRDLQGVKVLAIAEKEGAAAVAPPLDLAREQAYPLAEPLYLYVHPKAPAVAREFCKFATGAEAAKIVQQFGIWPEYLAEEANSKQRVADVKAGKAAEIPICDLTGCGDVLKDLSLEFVRAKANTAIQLKFQKAGTRDEALQRLAEGATELLLTDGPIPQGGSDTQAGRSHPGPFPEGEVRPAASPPSPRNIELGRMAVAVIVHADNPLESLPLDEARGIFCGEIKKWPAVRGAAAAMHVFGLEQRSPIAQLLKEKLSQPALSPALSRAPAQRVVERASGSRRALRFTAQPDNEKVILAVARDPAAIGFVDLGRLPPKEKSVKLVRILGQASAKGMKGHASPLSLAADSLPEDYPLARTLMLCVSPHASQAAKDFVDFLTPEHCKQTLAKYNLLPPRHAADHEYMVPGRQMAKVPQPGRSVPEIKLTSADEPLPLLLDDPDSPQDQPPAKSKQPVAIHKPEVPAPADARVPPNPVSATPPASAAEAEATSQPTQGRPAAPPLLDKQTTWIVCGLAGVVVFALGAGWLSAAKPKKRPRGKLQ